MTITLNHTIVVARDKIESAAFLAEVFGLSPPERLGHFVIVRAGPTSLDYVETDGPIEQRHFAFLVSEPEFDAIMARIEMRKLSFWADPFRKQPGAINTVDDGRGVYFNDPSGHLIEAITRPYGSGGLHAKNPNPLLTAPLS
ncbi:MAG: VOC family protein [Parvularculaceae bacterium]|nr:VOC family protein [Parvularculaceae bacterium]